MNLTKRQKEILDFIRTYRTENGISPTQREIRETFQLSSFGTVQKHLKRLEEKGALSREWNRSRGIAPKDDGSVARGRPAARPGRRRPPDRAASRTEESIEVPASLLGKGEHFVLRVRGESMVEDGILDGDYVVVARRTKAESGQTVVALVRGEATLKRYYAEGSAGPPAAGQRVDEAADLRRARRHDPGRRDGPDPRLRPRPPGEPGPRRLR